MSIVIFVCGFLALSGGRTHKKILVYAGDGTEMETFETERRFSDFIDLHDRITQALRGKHGSGHLVTLIIGETLLDQHHPEL
jgi:hypothetical protein